MPLTREGIASRIAHDLPDGSFVNLGFGIPSLVTHFLPLGKTVLIHSKNGILGAGPKEPRVKKILISSTPTATSSRSFRVRVFSTMHCRSRLFEEVT
jgi:acyl CoA:acetate/3-ketoacid CoA transferase beta subunit